MVLLCIFHLKIGDDAVPDRTKIRWKVIMQRLMTSVILRGEFGLDKYCRGSCWKHDEEAGGLKICVSQQVGHGRSTTQRADVDHVRTYCQGIRVARVIKDRARTQCRELTRRSMTDRGGEDCPSRPREARYSKEESVKSQADQAW
jgi:hypothetical protein